MNFTQQLWSVKEWTRVMTTGNEFVSLVHEATNEEKWGPTGPQMEAICVAYPRGSQEILQELRSRLNNRDKAWRPCYKSLLVIDYLVRNVNDRYIPELCSIVSLLRTISQSFYYTNPKGIDHGVSVRERAKKLAELMSDGLLLREERVTAAQTKAKLSHNAAEGGAPNRYRGDGGQRYGGYPSNYTPTTSSAGSPYGSRPTYDPYRPSPAAAPPPGAMRVPRTKEEQERYDMEVALRMQREEEQRSGFSAERLEAMYAEQAQQRKGEDQQRQRQRASDDEELARRLQGEEEQRARREGRSLPQLGSERSPTYQGSGGGATTASTSHPAPTTSAPPASALDDLFAPAPVSAPAAPPASAAAADPFDAFLDSRLQGQPAPSAAAPAWGQSQPVQNNWTAPQQNSGWGQTQQPQQSVPQPQQSTQQQWGQPQQPAQQQQQWGQPQQPAQQQQQWGQPQQSTQQPQQSTQQQWGQPQQSMPQTGGWGQPQQQQWTPPQQTSGWGQPSASSNNWAMPSAPVAGQGAMYADPQKGKTEVDTLWGS